MANNPAAKDKAVAGIEKIKAKREERRANLEKIKDEKSKRNEINKEKGNNCDVEFDIMIEKERFKTPFLSKHTSSTQMKLCVNVRKRPLFEKEIKKGNYHFFVY